MVDDDLNDKMIHVFETCPYRGKRDKCSFIEMREMEINERQDLLNEMDEDEKIKRWQKHLKCLMNALAR
jgi:L-rhamnose mutarotase